MTTGGDQLSGQTEKKLQSTSQSQSAPKKGRGHWWSAAGLIHYSSLIPAKPLHGKPQHLQLVFVNRKGPVLHKNTRLHITQPMLQKLNELGYEVLLPLPYSRDLSPADYHLLEHLDNFLQGKCFYIQQDAENAFQGLSNPKAKISMLQEQTNFVGKNVLIVMVPILINKDVFEPSYNDLNFRV